MSYWSNHPEELDEITIENLPKEWQEKIHRDEISLYDVPDDIMLKAMIEGVQEYWANKVDHARSSEKEKWINQQ